ncbi:MAG: hypothetical protein P4L79_01545 [Legionella sp.]|uniref:hypothetical protein n=1 Tax=Legionella sp. TaxID=459 RepID=UPI00283EB02D|nr:hypothetical protein [Legionella sp.]
MTGVTPQLQQQTYFCIKCDNIVQISQKYFSNVLIVAEIVKKQTEGALAFELGICSVKYFEISIKTLFRLLLLDRFDRRFV